MADASFALLCLVLMLGPAARFVPRLRRFVPWSRELGIAMFVTAALHVVILIDEAQSLSDAFLSSYWFNLAEQEWHSAANWVGLVALAYALVLAATSNDFSQRLLRRGWKFLQRQTYTLFVLTVLHTAGFILFWEDQPPVFAVWFLAFTVLVGAAQLSGFVHTVRSPRGPSPQRPPPRTRTADSKDVSVAFVRWVSVLVLWGVLISTVYELGHGQGF